MFLSYTYEALLSLPLFFQHQNLPLWLLIGDNTFFMLLVLFFFTETEPISDLPFVLLYKLAL